MDEAGRYTAEHNVMEANLKIASLEGRIKEIVKENKQLIEENRILRKKMQDQLSQPKIKYTDGTEINSNLINNYDIGKFQKA
jgi:regulator of replication initiation timing|tara:strand:+ start:413 stop:658 length:246 start_codon:yes stop_codon:yes gene_type:complete